MLSNIKGVYTKIKLSAYTLRSFSEITENDDELFTKILFVL